MCTTSHLLKVLKVENIERCKSRIKALQRKYNLDESTIESLNSYFDMFNEGQVSKLSDKLDGICRESVILKEYFKEIVLHCCKNGGYEIRARRN